LRRAERLAKKEMREIMKAMGIRMMTTKKWKVRQRAAPGQS